VKLLLERHLGPAEIEDVAEVAVKEILGRLQNGIDVAGDRGEQLSGGAGGRVRLYVVGIPRFRGYEHQTHVVRVSEGAGKAAGHMTAGGLPAHCSAGTCECRTGLIGSLQQIEHRGMREAARSRFDDRVVEGEAFVNIVELGHARAG
jgi:hypothetical protein